MGKGEVPIIHCSSVMILIKHYIEEEKANFAFSTNGEYSPTIQRKFFGIEFPIIYLKRSDIFI